MRFYAAGASESAGSDSEAAVVGASSSLAPTSTTCTREEVPAMPDSDQGAAPGDGRKLKRVSSDKITDPN